MRLLLQTLCSPLAGKDTASWLAAPKTSPQNAWAFPVDATKPQVAAGPHSGKFFLGSLLGEEGWALLASRWRVTPDFLSLTLIQSPGREEMGLEILSRILQEKKKGVSLQADIIQASAGVFIKPELAKNDPSEHALSLQCFCLFQI